jgi:hypothetical protein
MAPHSICGANSGSKSFAHIHPFDFRTLAIAAHRLGVEQAARVGMAGLGAEGVAAVLEDVDGGKATAEVIAAQALEFLGGRS